MQFLRLVMSIEQLVQSGDTAQASLKNQELKTLYASLKKTLSIEDQLELLGFIALTIREAGQAEMAIPWQIELCDLALDVAPDSENTVWDLINLAECWKVVGRVGEAINILNKAQNIVYLSDQRQTIFAKLETLMSGNGGDRDVMDDLSSLIASAQRCYRKNQYQEAIFLFTDAIKLANDNGDIFDANLLQKLYYNRGVCYMDTKDYGCAIHDLSTAQEFSPKDSDIYNERGCVYIQLGDINNAIADFEQALEVDETNTKARNNLMAAKNMREHLN